MNKYNITIKTRPLTEFKYFVTGYLEKKDLDSFLKDNKLAKGKRVEEIYTYIEKNQKEEIKKEIEFFSNNSDTLAIALKAFVDDFPELYTVEDYFDKLDITSDQTLFNYLGGSFLREHYKGDNNWQEVKNDFELMKNYINSISLPKKTHVYIKSLFSSPKETRARLRLVLMDFYNFYKEFQEEITKKIQEEAKKLNVLLENRPEELLKKYFSERNIDPLNEKIEIHPSFMLMYKKDLYKVRNTGITTLFLGLRYDEYLAEKEKNYGLDKFLKIISDETRQNILKILSEKESYTQALAKELNLAAPTISYHMQNFIANGLVKTRQNDNDIRIYYSLNKEKVREYIELLSKKLNL